jgi:hypothetical protein
MKAPSLQAAAIVEPRNHNALPLVICNALTVLPAHWNIYLFHGTENIVLAESLQDLAPTRVHLVPLGAANLTIADYNTLLCNRWFWDQIQTTSHVLIFQTDSLLLEKSPFHIDDFLRYDYIGAPWPGTSKSLRIGNGGLSCRRKTAMLEAIATMSAAKAPALAHVPEDVRFARFFWKHRDKYILPSLYQAQTFSVERLYFAKPFGIHAAYKKLPRNLWQQLVRFDPLLALIERANRVAPS